MSDQTPRQVLVIDCTLAALMPVPPSSLTEQVTSRYVEVALIAAYIPVPFDHLWWRVSSDQDFSIHLADITSKPPLLN